jgi:hypothetical protein
MGNSSDLPGVNGAPSINAMAEAAETAMRERRSAAGNIGNDKAVLDTLEKDMVVAGRPHFLGYFAYFDVGTKGAAPAYRSVDGHKSIDAAICALYGIEKSDKAGLKAARNQTEYRRRVGATLAGAELRGSQSGTEAEVKAPFEKVTAYLEKNLGKLSHAEVSAVAEQVNSALRAHESAALPIAA